MTPAPPRALLFDWDNTLVDAWQGVAAALNQVFARRGMTPWTAAETQARVRGSARETFPEMFGADWRADLAIFHAALADHHLRHLHPMPGAELLLRAAQARPAAVVSNKTGQVLRREVTHLGWDGYFAAVIGAGDASADKPDAAPLLLACERLGLPPGPAIWYVGDTALDMQAARAAGCTAVLVGSAAHDGGLARARPDLHYPSLSQLRGEIAALAS